jgi:CHAT domain-containing protein/tetratricopeptide (TPR) repeat protein
MLVFFLAVFVFGQDKQVNADKDKQLREEILEVYQSKGEQGLRDFVIKEKEKITNKFIVDLAKEGVKERKEEWLKICEIMAEEKNDEKALADVLYRTGEYLRSISDNKKAADYLDKALPIYKKLKDLLGQGRVYLTKGNIHSNTGKNQKALEMYEKALIIFKKMGDSLGIGHVYSSKGSIYLYTGNTSKSLEMYEKALFCFEKVDYTVGQGHVHLMKGLISSYIGKKPEAIKALNIALHFFEKAEDSIGQGNVCMAKGDIYLETGEYSSALETFDKALPFFEKANDYLGQGNVYSHKAEVYLRISNFSKVIELLDKALPFLLKAGLTYVGDVYLRKGRVFQNTGEHKMAINMYNKALASFKNVEDALGMGNVYKMMGDIFLYKSNYSRAFELYDKALALFLKTKSPQNLGIIFSGKGDIYFFTGNNTKADELYDTALHLFEKAEEPIGQGKLYLRKGDIYSSEGKYSKAIDMYDKALHFYRKAGEPLGQSNIYNRKGEIYFSKGENSKALVLYERAMLLVKKSGDLLVQGVVHSNIGDIYLKTGKKMEAIEMFERADELFQKIGEILSASINLHKMAKIYLKQGEKNKALNLFGNAISKIEKARDQTAFSEMKKTFMESVYKQYEETVLFMLENKCYDKGFKYAESMKARVFLDQMGEGLVPLEKGLKPGLKEKRDKLVGKLSFLSKEIHKTEVKEKKKLEQLKKEHGKVESEFEELLIKIRLENSLYASVRYPEPISVKNLQEEILKKGEILVRYFITSNKSYVFLVSKKKLKVVPLEVKAEKIKSYVNRFLMGVRENNTGDMKRCGKLLYRGLFKPIETKIKGGRDIIIIPDRHLEKIPFESFIIGEEKSGRSIFLLEKYRIKYIQSASLLSVLRKHYQRDRETNDFIGFGDPVYDYENFRQSKKKQGNTPTVQPIEDEIKQVLRGRYDRAGGTWKRLFHSGEEVKAIARLFEEKSQKCTVHLREQATEDNARASDIKDFDFVHFACHGLLNDDFQSLVLSQLPPDKSQQDGYFTLNEIMNCDYNAKLVVLSACQTGSGKMERAEGVTGLTRAFMYAGTPAVIASLWHVDDPATKELMVTFYRNMLEKNLDKTEALRQAKLELIKGKKYVSPLFWGAFVMYGE